MENRLLNTQQVLTILGGISYETFRQLRKKYQLQRSEKLPRGYYFASQIERFCDDLEGKRPDSTREAVGDRIAEKLRAMHGQGKNAVSGN